MLTGEFKIPTSADISSEFDQIAAHMVEEKRHLDFGDYMDKAELIGVSSRRAAVVLKEYSGDFAQAHEALAYDRDPAVNYWQQAVGASALDGFLQQNTFEL